MTFTPARWRREVRTTIPAIDVRLIDGRHAGLEVQDN